MNAPDLALRVNPDWAKLSLFDRSKWKRVRFGDVVENLNETCDPAEAGVERYIGLEHLEPGSLHIRSWGNVADGTTFTRRVHPGQVLFGKRRAYQRKVAVASFDAVVSGDIYVLTPRGDRLQGELLPFLCMSDRFFNHAVGTSAGSLSPRTNWSSLASFEFELPPLEQQSRMVGVVTACDESQQASTELMEKAVAAKAVLMERETQFEHGTGAPFPKRLLGNIVTLCQYGLSIPLAPSGEYPVLRMMNYDEERVVHSDMAYVDVVVDIAREFIVEQGDILFNRTNSADLVGKVGIFDLDGDYLFASYLVRLRTNRELMIPEFLNYFLNSVSGQRAVRAFASPGVSQSNISAGNLKKVKVPVPPLSEQETIVRSLQSAAASARHTRDHVQRAREQLLALTNAIWTDSV